MTAINDPAAPPPPAIAPGTDYFAGLARWRPAEIVFWVGMVGLFFVPDANLPLFGQIIIWGLFAMSLDLLLGYRGIPSMGHAAFFGIGAYTAGYLGKFGWTEPISGLVIAMILSGIVGLATGQFVQRVSGIALLMVTLGLNLILYDVTHRMTDITGGDDGLPGVVIGNVLGWFRFDIYGRTAYWYALVVTFLLFLVARALVKSPFGLALLGARESPRRMIMLGAPIEGDVSKVFAISAAMAGAAGALLTQTTQFVAPGVVSFQRSADVLVILILGGTGSLYGAFVGAFVFLFLRDWLAALSPVYWYFWIGLLLVIVVAFFRKGILPSLVTLFERFPPHMNDAAVNDIVLETRDLHMAFGGLVVFEKLNFSLRRGERHAIIGPNGAGKTTFVSLVTGLLRPVSGDVMFNGQMITGQSPQQRVKAGIARTFQINTLFRALNALESVVLALCERDGRAGISLARVAKEAALIEEARALLAKFGLARDALVQTDTLPYGKQRLLEVALALALKPQILLLDEPAAGLSTEQGHDLFGQLAALAAGTTILFIEHDMNLVFRYADKVSVFAAGALVVQDVPENVRVNPRVREVYLGT